MLELLVQLRLDLRRAHVPRRAFFAHILGFGLLAVYLWRNGAGHIQLKHGEAVKAVLLIPLRMAGIQFCIGSTKDANREFAPR